MLNDNGIYDVQVGSTPGQLSDHYNPSNKTVNLSPEVYSGVTVAAAEVAAHECGHAVQHAKSYSFLNFRSAMVPLLSVTNRFTPFVIMLGFGVAATMQSPLLLWIGILLFALTTIFSFITLPVEYDATRRGLEWLESANITRSQEEHKAAKNALGWAARTYVVAALGSLAQLLYYINVANSRRD